MLFVAVAIFRCSLGLVSIGVPGVLDGEARWGSHCRH